MNHTYLQHFTHQRLYQKASEKLEQGAKENVPFIAINKLKDSLSDYIKVIGWRDTKEKMEECRRLISENVEKIYEAAQNKISKVGKAGININRKIVKLEEAMSMLQGISEYKNVEADIVKCEKKIETLEKKKKRNRVFKLILCGVMAIYIVSLCLLDFEVEDGRAVFSGSKYMRETMQIPKRIFIWPVVCIDSGAFEGCSDLLSVKLPESVVSIEDYAFSGCEKLAVIELPQNISYIGTAAFLNCSSLEEIVLPQGITGISESAFYGCTNLEKINLPSGILSIENYAFANCYRLTNIKLPTGLEKIGAYVFSECKELANIDFSEGLSSIEVYAFKNCGKITNLDMPVSLETVGSYAFENCSSLETIEFHENLISIGGFAFKGCDSLKSITIESKGKIIAYDLGLSEQVVVKCYKNTPVAEWAKKYGLTVEWLD